VGGRYQRPIAHPAPATRQPPAPFALVATGSYGIDRTPIGGTHSPERPILTRPTAPVDPVDVDPLGGRDRRPIGQPDPIARPPKSGFAAGLTTNGGVAATPIGGTHSPERPILTRPTPPVDPVDVDPLGGRDRRPIGQPDPIARPPKSGFAAGFGTNGETSGLPGNRPIHGIFPTDSGLFAFEPAVQYFFNAHPQGAFVADLNGDGRVEIAVTCSDPDRVAILQNLGHGDFGRPVDILLPLGSGPDQVVAGNFTGDGRLDLAVTLRNMDAVALLRNERGFSGLAEIVATGVAPCWLAAGDFDGDGSLDLVVSNTASGNLTLLLNDGDGNFKVEDIGVGPNPRAVAVADFDGDSLPDIAVAVTGTHSIEVLKNFRGGVFKAQWTLSTGRFSPESLVASDLEGDGDVDISVTAAGADVSAMLTFLNSGNGSFDAGPVIEMDGTGNSALAAADFDLDHNLDLACVAASESSVSVWHNLGMGRFATYSEFPAGRAPVQVVAADLDGNASMDLVVVNSEGNSISILINMVNGIAGVPFCFGDGTGTTCPVRNNGLPGHGCDNAAGTGGALLLTSGAARISNDTLALVARNLPRTNLVAFFQAPQAANRGFGVPFSHGLACLDGTQILLGVTGSAQGTVQYPNLGQDKVSVIGQLPPGGGTRYYQVWYRDNAPPMTYQAYNLSNGLSVTWIP
jgi:hypothetical protein